MNDLFKFLASTNGRITRVVAGIVLILIGLVAVQGTVGWIIAIIGLIPLLAGAFDYCAFAPLFKLPFKGSDLRSKLGG
jgi:heme A synthase